MPTWTVTAAQGRRAGHADTTAQAWRAAHDAAREIVRAAQVEVINLDVDGQISTVHPARSGDHAVDLEGTLQILDDGQDALVAAYQDVEEA